MKAKSLHEAVRSEDLLTEPTIKIESQESIEGEIRIEARPTGRAVPRGTISISVKDSAGSGTVHFLPRHARELATTLLAVADKTEQFPAESES